MIMVKGPTRNTKMKEWDVREQGKVSRFKCLCYQKIIIKSIMQNIFAMLRLKEQSQI